MMMKLKAPNRKELINNRGHRFDENPVAILNATGFLHLNGFLFLIFVW